MVEGKFRPIFIVLLEIFDILHYDIDEVPYLWLSIRILNGIISIEVLN
jgi:hypothetical protein